MIGHSSSNSGSYVGASGNHAIAGAGVSGFASYNTFDASTTSGTSTSLQFSTSNGDLVLIVVGGEGDGDISISGINAQNLVDQTYSETGGNVIASAAIYSAVLDSGIYDVSFSSITYPSNSGTSIGAVAYVFTGASIPPPQSSTTVSCSPNPTRAGSAVTCTATVSGSNPTGTITWTTSSQTGSFNQTTCQLTSGTCSTTYSDTTAGSVTITASYSGDSNNSPSTGDASLTVGSPTTGLVAPTVTPNPDIVDQGQTSSLTSTAVTSGTSPYTYQWFAKAPGESYVTAGSNSTSFNLATSGSTATGSWSFILQVTDNTGAAVNSTAVSVTVNPAPTVSITPVGPVTLDAGTPQTFTASASGGTGILAYQWYLNGSPVGSDSNTYSFSGSAGSYSVTCTVTDSASTSVTSVSNAVSVMVSGAIPASISLSPDSAWISENPIQSSTITATVLDQNGNPIQGCQVTFTTTAGVLSSPILTDSNGQTQVTLTPNSETTQPLTVTVVSYAGNIENSTTIIFEPPTLIYSITTSPQSATVSLGQTAITTIIVSSAQPSLYTVGFSILESPYDVAWQLSQGAGEPPFTSTLTLYTNGGPPSPPGTYVFTITGYCLGETESTNFTLTIVNPQASTGNLQVVAYDKTTRNPMPNVLVQMTSAPSGQSLLSGTTDSNGQYLFQNVAAGQYTVSFTASGYQTITGSGSLNEGSPNLIAVNMVPNPAPSPPPPTPTYTVTFSESGLSSGVQWGVTLNGKPYSATSSSISITGVSNGAYPWSLSPPNGYAASQTSGTIYVSGISVYQTVTFQKQTTKTTPAILVTCSPSSTAVSSPVTCTVTVTGTNPNGSITWSTSSGTGSFKTSSSSLVSGSCSVSYTDTSSGTATITATYSGDSNNAPSSSSTTLTILSSSQSGYVNIVAQYTGYFLEYLPFKNTFSVYTSLSGASPVQVYGVIDGTNYPFSSPQGSGSPYTLTVDMGSLTPGSSLVVYAKYSGVTLTNTYPLQIIDTPEWLMSIISFAQDQSGSPITIDKDSAGYHVTLTEDWDIGDGFNVNVPLPSFAAGGNYKVLPSVEVTFTFSSDGSFDLSDELDFKTNMTFGPVDTEASIALNAEGDFQLSGTSISWVSGTMTLTVDASASEVVPIAGYTFQDTPIGDITIGLDATISVDAGFTASMI